MTILDVVAVIVLVISLLGLLNSHQKLEPKQEELKNVNPIINYSTIVIINVSIQNTSIQTTETYDVPVEVINPVEISNPRIDWRTLTPKKLVNMVIDWSKTNINYGENQRNTPNIKINYSKNGTVLGRYFFDGKLIEIFIHRHKTLESLIDTILHGYIHFLQLRYQKDDMKYDNLTSRVGYYDNPFEVEARKLARKHRKQCIADLNLT